MVGSRLGDGSGTDKSSPQGQEVMDECSLACDV